MLADKPGVIVDASWLESKLGLTVALTDAVSNLWSISEALDSTLNGRLVWQRGLLFPDFGVRLVGNDFRIEVEKCFAGGATLQSERAAPLEAILKKYRLLGPRPFRCFADV